MGQWFGPLLAAIVLPGIWVVWMLVGGYEPSLHQSTFDVAGPVARMQRDLFWAIFWSATVIFILVEGILVYAIFRFRSRPGQRAPSQTHGHYALEIGWTIAPAIVLAIVAVPTVDTLWKIYNVPPKPGDLEVTVTGYQWWWKFEYPGLGVVSPNEIHIPENTRVRLTLKSENVIHSFWIPKLGGKLDVMPNHTNVMWLQGDAPGVFYGQCAEFCGESHAFMRFRAVVETKADFATWAANQKADSVAATGAAADGQAIFLGKGTCSGCHVVRGTNARSPVGPDLTHVGSRLTIADGMMPNNHDSIMKWLTNPTAVKPGNLMGTVIGSKIKFTPEELNALAAYIQSLK